MEFSKQEALLVEPELGVGGDEEGRAEQEEREVEAEGGVGDVEPDAADGGFVAQPVAEAKTGEGHERVAQHEDGGEDDFAQAGGGRNDVHETGLRDGGYAKGLARALQH